MPKLTLTLLLLSLTACAAFNPPKPRVPNENDRQPINAYQPYQAQGARQ